jgi:hypothetical protein
LSLSTLATSTRSRPSCSSSRARPPARRPPALSPAPPQRVALTAVKTRTSARAAPPGHGARAAGRTLPNSPPLRSCAARRAAGGVERPRGGRPGEPLRAGSCAAPPPATDDVALCPPRGEAVDCVASDWAPRDPDCERDHVPSVGGPENTLSPSSSAAHHTSCAAATRLRISPARRRSSSVGRVQLVRGEGRGVSS